MTAKQRLEQAVRVAGFNIEDAITAQERKVSTIRARLTAQCVMPTKESWDRYDEEVAYLDVLRDFERYQVIP